jgi:predicted nucleotidyltransferase
VEFEPNERVGYFKLSAMERELSGLLGRRVDLRTPDELSRYFRNDVLSAAQVQYVRE